MHGLHMNLKGKTWLINKLTTMVSSMMRRRQKKLTIPLPWIEENKDSKDELVNKNKSASEGPKPIKQGFRRKLQRN
jgi:hypothetical protein